MKYEMNMNEWMNEINIFYWPFKQYNILEICSGAYETGEFPKIQER